MARADSFDRFFRAVNLDDGKTVAQLLARGFDPNTLSERGEPALVTALRDGRLEVAEALWKHPDLQLDLTNPSDETPLMMASLRGNLPWVTRLLERGAAVNRPGWSPILYAATGGDVATVIALVKAGADVNAKNPAGSTPLIMAARFGSVEVMQALLNAGADPRYRNPGGQDAAAAARWAGRESVAEALDRITSKPAPRRP